MTDYRVLVVDDQMASNRQYYKRLLDGYFQWDPAKSEQAFREAVLEEFDAIVLDVNLNSEGWDLPLAKAADIIRGRRPVVLVSQWWEEGKTHQQVSAFMAQRKDVQVIQTMTLKDLTLPGWEDRVEMLRERLRLAIGHHHRRGKIDVDPHQSIYLLHISDPQYGDPGKDNWAYLAEFDIADFVTETLKVSDVHFLAITGDITYSGAPEQYEDAAKKLDALFKRIWPIAENRRERILLVPGNHDVNLSLSAADYVNYSFKDKRARVTSQPNTSAYHRYGLSPFREFAKEITADPRWSESVDLCWINDSFRHVGIRFFFLNSASGISCAKPSIAQFSPKALTELVNQSHRDDNTFRIGISHHGPRNGPNSKGALEDWPTVSNFLRNAKIRLFLHGHGHRRMAEWLALGPEIKRNKVDASSKKGEVVQVMAPTTHLNNKKRPRKELRGFNVVELQRKNAQVYQVNVQSFELDGKKPTPTESSKSFYVGK